MDTNLKLSIVVPTIGRKSLKITLTQLAAQMLPGDEIIVVEDGTERAKYFCELLGLQGFIDLFYVSLPKSGGWGYKSLNYGYSIARGHLILSLADDDQSVPNHLDIVRNSADLDKPTLYKRLDILGGRTNVIWEEQVVTKGNVDSQMLAVPNIKEKLGYFDHTFEGSYNFCEDTIRKYNGQVKWIDQIITIHGISQKDQNNNLIGEVYL